MSTLIIEARTVMSTLNALGKQPTFLIEMRIAIDRVGNKCRVKTIDYLDAMGDTTPLSSLDTNKIGEVNGCFGHVVLLDDEANRKQLERFITDKVREYIDNTTTSISIHLVSCIRDAINDGFKMFCDAHSFEDKEELESFAAIFDKALNLKETTSGTWSCHDKCSSAICSMVITRRNLDEDTEYEPICRRTGSHSNTVLESTAF